jgi:hypothetical protein
MRGSSARQNRRGIVSSGVADHGVVQLRSAWANAAASTWRQLFDNTDPKSLVAQLRSARWDRLVTEFPGLASYRVLDLGGTAGAWERAPIQPRELVLVNLPNTADLPVVPRLEPKQTVGDATDPGLLLGEKFDLVYSNSVIEHVGGAQKRQDFANNVARLAPRCWIQTPYRWFPIEPHWLFPGLHLLPLASRLAIARRWPMGYIDNYAGDREKVLAELLAVELLTATEYRHLFPNATIKYERLGGLPKSLIAVTNV